MLGRTAAGLFWLTRYLERAENTSRLAEAGFRMALTRSESDTEEWGSVITTAGCQQAYLEKHETIRSDKILDFLLRDKENPNSVLCAFLCRSGKCPDDTYRPDAGGLGSDQ